jgi:hypothetical protein
MKKFMALAVVAALVCAAGANAANVTMGINSGGASSVTVAAGTAVPISITAVVDSGTTDNDGLALWGADLNLSGNGAVANLSVVDPTANPMLQFTYPQGVTNPPHVANASGYRGTVSGNARLQVGGGQNTIGNPSSGGAPFPIGTVIEEVGSAGSVVVATGTYNVPIGATGQHIITLANCFANTIDNNEAGPTVYNVSAATTTCGAALTINVGAGTVPAALVSTAVSRRTNPNVGAPGGNCDTNLLPARKSEMHNGGAQNIRVGFNVVPGSVSGTNASEADINLFVASCPTGTFTDDDTTVFSYSSTTGTLIITAAPGAFTNARTYRFDLISTGGITSAAAQSVFVRNLAADTDGNGLVNAVDRSNVVGAWTGPGGWSCNSDIDNNGTTNAVDRSNVVGAWTNPAANCAP